MSDGHTQRLESALDGKYRIERKLGEGGMASVYLAEDIKHERKVALKILRPELAAVIGAERFLSEIKTTANLQHPHILPLFDSGEASGYLYYVMPFIDGETLRDRIEREGQLGVDEAIRIARDVADALDYAHRNDVIHRDIKPANILLHDGRPVVADFGIALAISAAGGGRMTETGLSLGTPHYMSPEQASADRDLSARSDVYSLGCVLYEMLAGQPPHTGPSAQSILVRILTEDPRDLLDVRRTVPPHIAATVMKSIEKLPADRFDSAKEFIRALEDVTFAHTAVPRKVRLQSPTAPDSSFTDWLADARSKVAAGLLVGLAGFAALSVAGLLGGPDADVSSGAVTAAVIATDRNFARLPAVARDGSVAFRQERMLWIRRPGALSSTPLEGTAGTGSELAFSPNSDWITFYKEAEEQSGAGALLVRVPAAGGPVSTLWSPRDPDWTFTAVAWSDDGFVYFAGSSQDALTSAVIMRVGEAGGGVADTLIVFADHAVPDLAVLPDGRGLALTVRDAAVGSRVLLLELASGDTTTLVPEGLMARYVETGHLVYAHPAGALYAVPFDARRMRATGPAVPVLDNVRTYDTWRAWYDVSPGGTLVYDLGLGGVEGTSFGWLDPTTGDLTVEPLDPTDHTEADLSRDGRYLAYIRTGNVWVYDVEVGSNRQLTEAPTGVHYPLWSPTGDTLVYRTREGGDTSDEVYLVEVRGSGSPRMLGGSPYGDDPIQWLDDGTIFIQTSLSSEANVYRLDASEGGAAEPILDADWSEQNPRVSPDGRWIAYTSDESGEQELYVRRWPDLTGRMQITSDGGWDREWTQLLWTPDSRTLYFPYAGSLRVAELDEAGAGFSVRDLGYAVPPTSGLWGLHPDGRLLLNLYSEALGEDGEQQGVVLISNWLTALRERLGEGN